MILANVLSGIITPIATIFGWLLAAFFSFSHNYGISIILLTLVTMIVVFPLTRKGTRSMMQMQLLQPELLKLRNKHKVLPGMSSQEKQEVRQEQQQAMMGLYRENGVSPTGGCLPMFLQFPIFIVLYDTIRGMTKTKLISSGHLVSTPEYINKKTALYTALEHSAGKLNSFGLNLADSVRTHQHSWVDVIPYVVVILVAVALQYVSIWQITNRNPAASQANPQMQAAQKFMPLIFIIFYIVLPAGVGIYFIVSSLFRVAQQEYMYKHDPHIVAAVQQLKQRKASDPTPAGPKKSWREMLREAAGEGASRTSLESTQKGSAKPTGKGGARPASTSANGRPAAKGGQARNGQARSGQPRSGQARSAQARDGQARSAQARNGQPRSGQPGDGKSSDGQPRSGQPRNGQPRNGQPRNGQPRNGQPGNGQPAPRPRPPGAAPGVNRSGKSAAAGGRAQGTGARRGDRSPRPPVVDTEAPGATPEVPGAPTRPSDPNGTGSHDGDNRTRSDGNGSGNDSGSGTSGEPRRRRRPA